MSVCGGGIGPARLNGPLLYVDEHPHRSAMSGQRNGRFSEAYDAPTTGWSWPLAALSAHLRTEAEKRPRIGGSASGCWTRRAPGCWA